MTAHSRISASAEIVGSIDDLLVKILLYLPVKSLVRFMSVSKGWKSLITSDCFSFRHSTGPSPAVGMFFCGRRSTAFEYIHLDAKYPSMPLFNELKFPDDRYTFWIQHACKGLFLCCSSGNSDPVCRLRRSPIRICYVFNPTLNLFIKLPRPGVTNGVPRFVHGVTLAFDQAKPPYKVVCVRGSELAPDACQIEIYSTECGEWSLAGKPFRAEVNFSNGVYWNGSVHWVHNEAYEVLFFNVDQDKFGKMLLPDTGDGHVERKIEYLGESYDILHLILRYDPGKTLIVYKMERDQPEWFAKYRVNVGAHVTALLGEVYDDYFPRAFTISCLVQRENETAFLVMKILNKVVLFNLATNTFQEMQHLSPAFEYIPSLSMFRSPPPS